MTQDLKAVALEYAQNGDIAKAHAIYSDILAQQPDDPDALHFFAVLAFHQNQFDKVIELARKALAARPDWVKAQNTLASAYKENGQYDQAIDLYEKTLEKYPDDFSVMYNLATTLYLVRHYERAATQFQKLRQKAPQDAKVLSGLSNCLFKLDDGLGAMEFAKEACALAPDSVQAINALGNAYELLDQPERAIEIFEEACARDPHSGIYEGNIGRLMFSMGRPEDASGYLQAATKKSPQMSSAYLMLARCLKQESEALILKKTIFDVLNRYRFDSEGKSDLYFALYHVGYFLKEYETAFEYLTQANELKRQLVTYNHEQTLAGFEQIKRRYKVKSDLVKPAGQTPIFILGMPRSGTTLIEQIISAHPAVSPGGEMPYVFQLAQQAQMTGADFQVLAQTYFNLVKLDETPYFTDKMPENFKFIGLIKTLWPHARIIHCQRDPLDTCLSNFEMKFTSGHAYIYDLESLGKYYRAYEGLMAHWQDVYGDDIYTVTYEDVIADQEGETRKLLDYCGLDFNSACLTFHASKKIVRTASATQVRQKIYTKSIQRWKLFETQLQPLVEMLKR